MKNYDIASMIEPRYFLNTMAGNVDNKLISDADFRDLVRRTLPIVNWPGRREFAQKIADKDQ